MCKLPCSRLQGDNLLSSYILIQLCCIYLWSAFWLWCWWHWWRLCAETCLFVQYYLYLCCPCFKHTLKDIKLECWYLSAATQNVLVSVILAGLHVFCCLQSEFWKQLAIFFVSLKINTLKPHSALREHQWSLFTQLAFSRKLMVSLAFTVIVLLPIHFILL